MSSVKYPTNLKFTCPSRKHPHSLSRVRFFLPLAPPALANLMPSSLQINLSPSGMEKLLGLEGSFLGQGWRLRMAKEEDFSSHQRRKQRCPFQSGLGLIFALLSSAHIQAGSLRLQEGPPVQRVHLTCNQTEAKGLSQRVTKE